MDDDAGFHIDPKSTRLGLKVNGVGLPCWQRSGTEAVVEVDFQGAFQSRNRGGLLLRKAYVSVSDGSTKLQAGQDWEVISPLYPKTLNYTAGACVGNVGYRRGMLRVDHRLDFHNSSDLTFQFALTDNVFRDNSAVVPASSRWPILQGRLAYSFGKDFFRAGPVTLGVSSHLGEQRYEFAGHRKFLKTWSLNVDANIPLTEKLGFQMEYFVGENLANIEGGILQGVDLVRGDTIRAQGGWAGLQYRWTKKLETNLCYLIDDPKNSDVIAGNSSNHLARNYNHCIFLNVLYNWSDALMTGFEVSFWRTHWQRYDPVSGTVTPLAPGKPTRLEFVTRYTF